MVACFVPPCSVWNWPCRKREKEREGFGLAALLPGAASFSFCAHSRSTLQNSRADVCMLIFIGRHFLNKTQFQSQNKLAQNWELVWIPRAKEMKYISIFFMEVFFLFFLFFLLMQHSTCYWSCREPFVNLCTMSEGCIVNKEYGLSSIQVRVHVWWAQVGPYEHKGLA